MERIEWLGIAVLLATLGGASWWLARADASVAAEASASTSNSFAIRDVRVFDGERVIDQANVVVRDGLITAVGKDAAIPSGIEVVEGRGKTVLPGLIDAHAHDWGEAQRDALRFGVTTELEMMGASQSLAGYRKQRESLARTDQADVFSSGAAVTVPGGHGTEYGFPVPELKADDDADAFVDARIREGSDFIKLMVDDMHGYGTEKRMPTLSRPQIEASIAATRRRDTLSVVHVSAMDDAAHAIDAGASGLAHVFMDQVADEALVASARSHGAFVIPTLSVLAGFQRTGEGAALADDQRFKSRLSSTQVATLRASFPTTIIKPFPALDRAIESTRRLHAAGVEILAGTDAGNPGTAHGASLHGELALLVRAGMTPIEALRAATSKPATRFGLKDRGRIAPRLRADLLLVEGDPTADITATRAITRTWKNGYSIAAAPTQAKVPALAAGDVLLSDFESGDLAVRFGTGWQAGSDQFMGGKSKAISRWLEGGANGSKGAMRIEGEVIAGAPYPWAGVMFSPGMAMIQPVDLSTRKAIMLKIRGTPGQYALLLLSGAGQPGIHPIEVGSDWRELRVPLAAINGADPARAAAISITQGKAGPFRFDIDDVSVE
ncbi:MAG: amidohydrolase [Pseudoxanthomonas suwonensis]|nr:MAG: amidohydrolase [Pseudoxanthomonas suwonensis]